MQWDLEEEKPQSVSRLWTLRILGALIALGVVVGLGLMVWKLLTQPSSRAHKIVQVSLLKLPPPPPPPPPKPEEKPPEPEIKKEEIKIDDPTPKNEPKEADPAPPAETLGVDAEGSGSGDGFGLQGRKGGRDITSIGGGGGGGSNRLKYKLYLHTVERYLTDQVARNPVLHTANYRALAKVWISPDGHVTRVELLKGTGNETMDQSIRTDLSVARLPQAPPADMPQPMKLQLLSQGSG